MIGETIGNFRIVSKLGRGGMGEVYAAEQVSILTRVAIKVLLPEVSLDGQQLRRFFNEAIAVSRIHHVGIAKIFDVGQHAPTGRAYLVMELLEGETLASRLQRAGRLTAWQVADIGKQIASVLEATHAAGITHRDLKPDNVFLVPDAELDSKERVKILDFGIAKLHAGAPDEPAPAGGTVGTTTGSMGTPTYMAPEQWRSSATVDWRADAYSLGCLAFEMACGRPPFVAASVGEACTMHLNDPPPSARGLVPALPAELDALLAQLLAKKPAERPESMAAIGRAFAALRAGEPPMVARTQPGGGGGRVLMPPDAAALGKTTLGSAASASSADVARPRRVLAIAIAALGVAAATGGAVWLARRAPAEPEPASPAKRDEAPRHAAVVPAPGVTPAPALPVIEPTPNAWVRIEPPARAVVLGVDTDRAPSDLRGFRPARRVTAPGAAYELQEHEVTWSELEPWLAANPTAAQPALPAWASDPLTRARLPATGVTWTTAYAYCKSLGGSLPTEAQWEYAARGPTRRPNAWGTARIDLALTHAFAGRDGKPVPVMTSDQDRTPDGKLFDLIGNAQEWTVDLWREDKPGLDESWVEDGVQTFRALRGFPLGVPVRPRVQPDGAAYREALCGTGPCVATTRDKLRFVGLRCARQVGDGEAEAHVWRVPAAAPHAAAAPATLVLESPPAAAGSAAGSAAAPAAAPVADDTPPAPAPEPAAPAAPAAPAVRNSLTPALIIRAVGAVRQAIDHCGAGLEGAGRVRVGVTVAPDGSITNVEVRETPDDWLGRCVATRIKAAEFPPTQFGGTFSYPFTF